MNSTLINGTLRKSARVLLLVTALPMFLLWQACGGSSTSILAHQAPLQAINITPASPFLLLAGQRQLVATGVYADGSHLDITSQVTWSASSASFGATSSTVSVSSTGLASSVSLGSSIITATQGAVAGALQITVNTNGYSSGRTSILNALLNNKEIDVAYQPHSLNLVQGAYTVVEVNMDADTSSSVLPVPAALLASIAMPPGFVPDATAVSQNSLLVAVISYSSPDVVVIDASNAPGDLANNSVIATFTSPVTKTATFNGIKCMICAAVVNPINDELLLSTAQGYYSMNLTQGTFTALPFASALPAPSFTLNPVAAEPYILSPTFGQSSSPASEVQILNLTSNTLTSNTNFGLVEPNASAIDLLSNFGVVVDAGASDQALLSLADLQNPGLMSVSNLATCADAAGSVRFSMAALGVAASSTPSTVSPTLFLSEPSGGCVGFELWASGNTSQNPANVGYLYGTMPPRPDNNPFLNGSDASAITTFSSVVDKKNYGVLETADQQWIAKINPSVFLSLLGTPPPLPGGELIPPSDLTAGQAGDAVVYLPTPDTIAILSQNNIVFGSQAVGTVGPPVLVTLTNISTVPPTTINTATLTISQITIEGPDAEDFAQTNTCASTLNAQSACTITITFTPTASGPRSASLSISDNGGQSPQSIALSGTGM